MCDNPLSVSFTDQDVWGTFRPLADHPNVHARNLGTMNGKPRRTDGTAQNPPLLLGYIYGNRHSFASNAWSGFGSGNVRQIQQSRT